LLFVFLHGSVSLQFKHLRCNLVLLPFDEFQPINFVSVILFSEAALHKRDIISFELIRCPVLILKFPLCHSVLLHQLVYVDKGLAC